MTGGCRQDEWNGMISVWGINSLRQSNLHRNFYVEIYDTLSRRSHASDTLTTTKRKCNLHARSHHESMIQHCQLDMKCPPMPTAYAATKAKDNPSTPCRSICSLFPPPHRHLFYFAFVFASRAFFNAARRLALMTSRCFFFSARTTWAFSRGVYMMRRRSQ